MVKNFTITLFTRDDRQVCSLKTIFVHMYRIYHEVEVSTIYTPKAAGPTSGCVNRVWETDTEWYNRLVPWATWLWQHIHGLATTASAIKGSSVYPATVSANHRSRTLSIEFDARRRWPRSDAVFCPTLVSSLTIITTVLSSLCRKGRPHSRCVEFNCWLGVHSLHPQVTR